MYGCCIEANQLLLVYEYLENNSLARALYGPEDDRLNLDWPTRQKICLGIAKGLAYLHEESTVKVVHRDIKTTNVLLDQDLNAKILDFGLVKLDEEENTHISTRIAGTIGYMAPEYELAVKDYLKQNEALQGILDKLRTDQAKGLLDSHHNGSNKTGLAEYTLEVLSIKDQLAKEQSKAEALSAVVYGEV